MRLSFIPIAFLIFAASSFIMLFLGPKTMFSIFKIGLQGLLFFAAIRMLKPSKKEYCVLVTLVLVCTVTCSYVFITNQYGYVLIFVFMIIGNQLAAAFVGLFIDKCVRRIQDPIDFRTEDLQ